MKRMLLTISYDGTAYHGWQVQPNGTTVQQTLQDSLQKILGKRTAVTGCSRTDAGVHAREFCCHFDCDENLPEKAFTKGLNSLLPNDIAVTDCKRVPDGFHARYSAKGKVYIYNILNSKTPDPFLRRYSWQIDRPLDTYKMNEFCKTVIGKHDFAAFSSSGRTVTDTVRQVFDCHIEKNGETVKLIISADGFLYNMVRIITGTAVAASFDKIKPEDMNAIFISGDRSKTGETAPPQGLFLEKVLY